MISKVISLYVDHARGNKLVKGLGNSPFPEYLFPEYAVANYPLEVLQCQIHGRTRVTR